MKNKQEVNLMNPLIWAYIGDGVYELFIRNHLVQTTNLKPHNLHINAIKYVKAKAQREILEKLKNVLTEEELEIVRRTRNAENHHIPKNADPDDYMYATAFEGLIGYLYLCNENERLEELLDQCI